MLLRATSPRVSRPSFGSPTVPEEPIGRQGSLARLGLKQGLKLLGGEVKVDILHRQRRFAVVLERQQHDWVLDDLLERQVLAGLHGPRVQTRKPRTQQRRGAPAHRRF